MSKIKVNSIKIKNYRSFGNEEQEFFFPDESYKKPVSVIGYNNAGKTTFLNSILYGLNYKYVSKETFTINDFHNRDINNVPEILLKCESSTETKFDGDKEANLSGYHKLEVFIDGEEIEGSKITSLNSLGDNQYGKPDQNYQAFGALRYFNVFYINFHEIKDEIKTQKTSWGNIRSFLGQHIQKVVDTDGILKNKKNDFETNLENSSNEILKDSSLETFISRIKSNFVTNLRKSEIAIEFGLPKYEDIFLHMLFRVGLNKTDHLVPIDHYGDGYISMFIMAVIKAIAEENEDDKCLFLFEEPESFLHENHQEFFYKTVLCDLAERGHQVIYTTHSDKMVDIFDTKSIIRLSFDEKKQQTVKTFNNVSEDLADKISSEIISEINDYNQYIKSIEPHLNRILFSNKVILVEGPNDLMVYKYLIKKNVLELIKDDGSIENKERYADTYLNFNNIVITPHHGKTTAYLLAKLCEFIGVDYFLVNDWDIENDELSIEKVKESSDINQEDFYKNADQDAKTQMSINKRLLDLSKDNQIHFNKINLESVIGKDFGKNSVRLWQHITSDSFNIDEKIFPDNLVEFLKIGELNKNSSVSTDQSIYQVNEPDDLPF